MCQRDVDVKRTGLRAGKETDMAMRSRKISSHAGGSVTGKARGKEGDSRC